MCTGVCQTDIRLFGASLDLHPLRITHIEKQKAELEGTFVSNEADSLLTAVLSLLHMLTGPLTVSGQFPLRPRDLHDMDVAPDMFYNVYEDRYVVVNTPASQDETDAEYEDEEEDEESIVEVNQQVDGNQAEDNQLHVQPYAQAQNDQDDDAPSICPVCGHNDVVHYHYGALSCKACSAVFRRYIKDGQPEIQCQSKRNKELRFCRPGNTDGRFRMCRFCRVKRCFEIGMQMNLVWMKDNMNRVLNHLSRQEIFAMRRSMQLPPIEVFYDERFPHMSEITQQMRLLERRIHHENPFNGPVRGSMETGSNFYSIQDNISLGESIYIEPQQIKIWVRQSTPYFIPLHLFRGYRDAQLRQAQWLDDNRNFFYPNTYIDRSMGGFVEWARSSLPNLEQSECLDLAHLNMHLRKEDLHIKRQMLNAYMTDDKVFYLFFLFIIVDRFAWICGDQYLSQCFWHCRQEVRNEFYYYHLFSGHEANDQILRIEKLLRHIVKQGEEIKSKRVQIKSFIARAVDRERQKRLAEDVEEVEE
ncbi:hypothetical protein L596_000367 [Steinernema carpocapsae]|uniref:Nuclear receptor domain-containing protein n=1 Tax=Steinernema carpocapsae TaxID=34508 RepID=A0A4U8UIR6_STECR|nr:hypothetical protein L596_000367 [Steinernema carpocapsae]